MPHSVQVRLDGGEISIRLSEMRRWLGQNGFEPDSLEYRRMDAAGVLCRIDFKTTSDAAAFAEAFSDAIVG